MRLKIAYHENPRIKPLLDGTVKLDGYDCDWEIGHAAELHGRHLKENCFDVFEFSFSNLLITKDKPERAHLRWVAVPVFLLRADFFLKLFAHTGSGVTSFADLKGKTLGVPDYQMTAAVWLRIILREMYGIMPQDIQWVNGRPPSQTHGENVTDHLAAGINVRRLGEDERLNDLLQRGEVDAALGDGRGCPVFPGPEVVQVPLEVTRAMLAEYHAGTGKAPINHVLIVQEHILQQAPDLPMQLYRTLEASKQVAYARAREEAESLLLFPELSFAENAARFGEDPYPFGLRANRHILETVIDELAREELTRGRIELDSLFAPSTLDT